MTVVRAGGDASAGRSGLMSRNTARRRALVTAGIALVLAACAGTEATAIPTARSPAPAPAATGVPLPSRVATPVPAPSSMPSPSSPSALTWREVRVPSIPATARIDAVVGRPGAPPLLVAVGTRDGENTGAAWTSTDGGATWSEPAELAAARFVVDVADTGAAFVAVGSASTIEGEGGVRLVEYHPTSARAWTSPDGVRWVPVDPPRSTASDMRLVVAGHDGVLALGGADEGPQLRWRSSEGTRWSVPAELDGVSADESLRDVVTLPSPGGYLAVGSAWEDECASADGYQGAAWISTDGSSWARVTGEDLGCGELSAVAGGPAGFVAAGVQPVAGSERRVAVAWVGDGLAWLGPFEIGSTALIGLATIDGVHVAIGDGIWESSDGMAWSRSAATPGVVLTAIGGGVAIGVDEQGGVAWVAERRR